MQSKGATQRRSWIRFVGMAAMIAIALGAILEASHWPGIRDERVERAAARALTKKVASLSPKVDRSEAERLVQCAYATVQKLRLQYPMLWPPCFNNILIHIGIKKRGLCFQWSEDLLDSLDKLHLRTLELHWGQSNRGKWYENNAIVITAKGQPFSKGLVVDCWRHCGRLYWTAAANDNEPWVENSRYENFVRAKLATLHQSKISDANFAKK